MDYNELLNSILEFFKEVYEGIVRAINSIFVVNGYEDGTKYYPEA